MAKITSSPLTFIDTTDSRKFEVHISSNLPQVQTYDRNNAVYSPDWSDTALNLQASIYLDSTDITANIGNDDVEWYKNTISTATKIGNGKTLIINTNALATEPIITYICQARYQNLTTGTRMDFTRIDNGINGINGTDGASAPAVQAQYSVDGSAWTATLNASAHKYVRYSYDGGKTWTTAIKMSGEDGTSVKIIGTAYTPDDLTEGEVVRLYSDSNNSTAISTDGLSPGDSYLVSGYLCVYNVDNDNFICAGTIQGPAGNDGESSYVFIRYATDANGTSMSTSPSGKTYIGIYTSNTNTPPTTASVYTWSKFVGDNAKSIILSGDSQVFKVSKSSAYTPATIKVIAQAINTSVTTWTYSTNGGQTFVSTVPTGVVRSGNIVTITGSTLTTNSVVIKASDGTVEDVFTVYKAFDGADGTQGAAGQSASMAFLTNENVTLSANASGVVTSATITTNVVAYKGTTKETPTIGTITPPTGMTVSVGTAVNNEIPIVFTVTNSNLGSTTNNNGSITIPVNGPVYTNLVLTWSKVNSGATGTSASLVDITPSALYFKSTTGKDGTFTPEFIYLYPRFQNVTYNGWQYSIDGGITWTAVTNANGLSVGTYGSVANTLRVSRASDLYTDTVTSISFRCVSSNVLVYDTVSIAKLFDVDVEEINTRITDGFAEVKATTDSISTRVSSTESSITTINNNVSSLTTRVSTAEQKITPTAIVSTVRSSTDYTDDLGKKVGTNEIISKINQTAESVTIQANKIGLLGATNIPDLTADKIKGGTLTLGGTNAQTKNGQILVKNASNTDIIVVNQNGMAITNGNLTIIDPADLYDYGGWSSSSHTELKTTGIESMYIAPNSNATYIAELDAISGLTMESTGGLNANPYYLHIGPSADMSDNATRLVFNEQLILMDDTTTIADISSNQTTFSTRITAPGAHFTSTVDAGKPTQGNVALRLGDPNDTHIDIDDNELVCKYGATALDSFYIVGSTIDLYADDVSTLVVAKDTTGGYIKSNPTYARTYAAAANVYINSSGVLQRSTSSSERYKTDITDVVNEDLNPYKILDIPVRQFKFNEDNIPLDRDPDDIYIGLIAEEVNKAYPAATEYTEDGQVEMWNIKVLFPALLKIVQDQQKEIKVLKEQINNTDELKQRIAKLEAMVEALLQEKQN